MQKQRSLGELLDSGTPIKELRGKIFEHIPSQSEGCTLCYHPFKVKRNQLEINDGYTKLKVPLKDYLNDKETNNYFFGGILMGMQSAIGMLNSGEEIILDKAKPL